MRILDAIEERIWNAGERLIPGVTHDTDEVIRHKSSYLFFKKVIENDLLSGSLGKSMVRILDIGCGVGHGTQMLAEIPGAVVTGIDSSEDAIEYARLHYRGDNITYQVADAVAFVKGMATFDYVVSRHCLEHIEDGIEVGAQSKFDVRVIVNVPFGEAEGNPYHFVHHIDEKNFENYGNREFFYEGLDGVTFREFPKKSPNSIVCVSSRAGLPKVARQFAFPLPAWQADFLQAKWLEAVDKQSDLDSIRQQQAARESEVANCETRLAGREADLAARESRCGSVESELAVREGRAAAQEADLAARESRCGSVESELAMRESRVAAQEADLAARQSHCELRESQLDTRESHLAAAEAASSERATEIQSKQQELVESEVMLRQRETALKERQASLDQSIQQFESRVIVRAYRKVKRLL